MYAPRRNLLLMIVDVFFTYLALYICNRNGSQNKMKNPADIFLTPTPIFTATLEPRHSTVEEFSPQEHQTLQ